MRTKSFFKTVIASFKKVKKIEEGGSQGFTLIDMLVTFGLFALLTTVIISSYPNSSAKVELANTVSDIQGTVRDSQLRATNNDSTAGGNGGIGLYFDPATTTSFFEFKDVATTTLALTGLLDVGDGLFKANDEITKTVTIPDGFYLRNTCAGDSSSRPFATSSCSRTSPSLGPVSIIYPRGSLQPSITREVGSSTIKYAAACLEFASVKSVSIGNVKNLIISQSGFSTTALGACDEEPIRVTVDVGGMGGMCPNVPMNCGSGLVGTQNPYPTCGYTCGPPSLDTQPPVITLLGSNPLSLTAGGVFTEPGVTAFDDRDGNVTSKITTSIFRLSTTTERVTLFTADVGESIYSISANSIGEAFVVTSKRSGKVSLNGNFTKYASNQVGVVDIVLDTVGNVYTANRDSNNVTKITPSGVTSILGSTGSFPMDIAIDSSGNIYTANSGSNNVTKITPSGVTSILGTTGSSPSDIVVDLAGNVYTSNYDSANVTKITPGGVSSVFGGTGTSPSAITIDASGNIYTVNKFSRNITKITPSGVTTTFGTTGNEPSDIAVDALGNIYTADYDSSTVTKITPSGVSTTFGTTTDLPTSLVLDTAGNVYLTSSDGNNVTKITPSGVTSILGTTGRGPEGIAIDPSGNLYTANIYSNSVTKITPGGVSSNLGVDGSVGGKTVTDAAGNIYEANNVSSKVIKTTPGGSTSILGTTGLSPFDITIDSAGNVYTANFDSNDVSKITPSGVSSILGTTGTAPSGITIDPSGNVYTANTFSNNVSKITPSGVSTILGTTGLNPRSPAIDPAGNVYTVNYYSEIVSKITPSGVSTMLGSLGYSYATNLFLDSTDNIYISSWESTPSVVTKMSPLGVRSSFASLSYRPIDVVGSPYGKISLGSSIVENLDRPILSGPARSISTEVSTWVKFYTVTDAAGNTATAQRIVSVVAGTCPAPKFVTCSFTHTPVLNPYPTCGYTCVLLQEYGSE
jgi:streptogramin lyase/type II secretory pathway pseudopilin PulG